MPGENPFPFLQMAMQSQGGLPQMQGEGPPPQQGGFNPQMLQALMSGGRGGQGMQGPPGQGQGGPPDFGSADESALVQQLMQAAIGGDFSAGTKLLDLLKQGNPSAYSAVQKSNPIAIQYLLDSLKPQLPPGMAPPGGPGGGQGGPPMPRGGPG